MTASTPCKAIATYCETVCTHAAKRTGLHDVTWWTAGWAVNRCQRRDCPLHPYRLGTNPKRAGIGGRPKRSPAKSALQAQGEKLKP